MKRKHNPEKPDFCEAKSHPKNKNSKLDICPIKKVKKEDFYEKTYRWLKFAFDC